MRFHVSFVHIKLCISFLYNRPCYFLILIPQQRFYLFYCHLLFTFFSNFNPVLSLYNSFHICCIFTLPLICICFFFYFYYCIITPCVVCKLNSLCYPSQFSLSHISFDTNSSSLCLCFSFYPTTVYHSTFLSSYRFSIFLVRFNTNFQLVSVHSQFAVEFVLMSAVISLITNCKSN